MYTINLAVTFLLIALIWHLLLNHYISKRDIWITLINMFTHYLKFTLELFLIAAVLVYFFNYIGMGITLVITFLSILSEMFRLVYNPWLSDDLK